MKASFFTLGCKLNQCETEALASAFKEQGFSIGTIEDPSDIYIINTCTVTSKSEQKARRVIRKASRENPLSLVIVTGCYAQLESELIASLGENVISIPLDYKDVLLDLAGFLASGQADQSNLYKSCTFWLESQIFEEESGEGRFRFSAADFNFHARAFLKIQDGCDHRCAYCRVCLARGKSVSLNSEALLERVKKLEEVGYREIVLTGVNIDSYKDGEIDLSGLLSLLIKGTKNIRFRLSSLEPKTLLSRNLDILSHPRICSHFHVSAQSGSDEVLKNMNRPYKAEEVIKAVDRLRELKDNPFIAADIIAGFPKESLENHRETIALLQRVQFSKIHVFPFSPRPDTPAWSMRPAVPERESRLRTKEIRGISNESFEKYLEKQVGQTLSVLFEENSLLNETSYWEGTSDNYLKVFIEKSSLENPLLDLKGHLASVKVLSSKNQTLFGEIVKK